MLKQVKTKLKNQLNTSINLSVDRIRTIEVTTPHKIRRDIRSYGNAIRKNMDNGTEAQERKRINEISYTHQECIKEVKDGIFEAVLDCLQLTDSVDIEKINENNKDFADGYLTHYSKAMSKIRELRSRL